MTFSNVEIARVRDYWNGRPCNIRHSTAPVGTNEYFDEVEARKYFVEYHIPGFAEFERWRGKKVLEIGCGIGTDTVNFARAGAQVTTVDLSEKSMELARKRAAVFGVEERIRFCPGNAEQLSSFVPPGAVRFDLFLRCNSPHAESGRGAGAASEVQWPGNNRQNHGLSPSVLESRLDSGHGGQGSILETARRGGEKL